ncbi:MAG: DUF3037 domain-containing protein [Dissulfurispiraceae bacterium]
MGEQTFKYTYKYAVLRYVPDFATDEFINAGVIMYCLEDNSIRAKLVDTTSRMECFDPDGDHAFFLTFARDRIEALQGETAKLKKSENIFLQELIERKFTSTTTPSSGMISFSDIKGGLTNDIDKEFEEIYDEYVGSKIKKKTRGPWGNLAVTKVYEMIDRIKDRLIKMPVRRTFSHPFIAGEYKCEVSFNDTDNINMKVLSLRPEVGKPHRLENIFAALPVLSSLQKQHKGHHFGGLIYFSPKCDKQLQRTEFDRLTKIFSESHLDCVRAEEKEMVKYFSEKKLSKK